ncbi:MULTISPECIES: TusE/DsrC/DsvC family sulfur relay protein [unclassified Nocardioides]|uniref:TusE/DsrC/DsvC family sulfur relay protein n=1 Tax=unclassified Nocardioides TaxID=2615069 RepID=UPI0009F1078D|nr:MULTISPECIES: TusE/DsrC/DsvC family sulfur relay protein [unclassified Nocardioides]GAW50892.1 DsrC family protein [Nocardioides sp. PD653-B2]GAW54050.1 DsrC family protein [Nocardioides sp. PD653]
MTTTTIGGHVLTVDQEGFLTDPSEWDDDVAVALAEQIGVVLDTEHREILRFLRAEHARTGETPTLRRVSTGMSIPVKRLFELFPVKPAKKMAYVAGLPKPRGCV